MNAARRSLGLKVGVLVVVLCGIGWGLKLAGVDVHRMTPEHVRAFVLSFGAWAPLVYLLAYGQPMVPFPASVLTITGGLAFGPAWGTLAALAGATIRACSEFLVARLLGREAVAKLLKGNVASLDEKLGANAFQTVLLIRLIPSLPFDVLNYGLGFSRVGFAPYALATFLGMMPGAFVYVYLGSSLTDPKNLWKLLVAIALIVGLMLAQRAWKKRQSQTAVASGDRS